MISRLSISLEIQGDPPSILFLKRKKILYRFHLRILVNIDNITTDSVFVLFVSHWRRRQLREGCLRLHWISKDRMWRRTSKSMKRLDPINKAKIRWFNKDKAALPFSFDSFISLCFPDELWHKIPRLRKGCAYNDSLHCILYRSIDNLSFQRELQLTMRKERMTIILDNRFR